ncbi:MAG: hypothetical protein ABFS32_19785 [Bacteroidota bacterium]
MKIRIFVLILLFVITYPSKSFGQLYSGNSIKLGIGFGMHMGKNTEGSGTIYTIGYQKEILNDRLRFNPNFSIGQYSSKLFPTGARNQYFNSFNLGSYLFYDLIRIKSVSIVLGAGVFINNSRGLKGSGGDPEFYPENLKSSYVSDYHFGGYFGGALRINPRNKRTAINIMPINVHVGINEYLEFNPKIEFDIKF